MLRAVEENVEVGDDDTGDDEVALNGEDEIRNLDSDGVKGNIFGNCSGNKGGKERSKNYCFNETKETKKLTLRRAEIKH